ncbi:pentapeptide repeat-containing protein [Methanosarcina mazei]|uniref:Pentapeptide repeat-containing protein n=1 Tax=Methanosarcina mazei TaxID=2209 RepID=A0A0F8IX71_METMZ|nr:pentapeptide repeat-containing protein [Methanosarcina mazei]KKG52361.1 hypothetical protein DU33_18830 [Methanosarcina mazei]KKG61345.1 hypothetical protein DU45_05975 [Methanosarcina mazei]KKG63282.1 hypothetical protein DU64_09410 [Methanosarcina mazei]KKG95231.1 hypothetical protein DU66_16150 [Methanosarcina mazei]KKG97343.1 hypothetical protein DU68_17485 [Methanosarcina mazei]
MASGNEEEESLWRNIKKDTRQICKKVKQYPLVCLLLLISVFLLIAVPHWQVSGIDNITEKATQENDDRTTLVQIFGSVAILTGIYFAWENLTVAQTSLKNDQELSQKNIKVALDTLDSNIKNAQENLKVAQNGQITERFTRAVDQLGNKEMEIRLGGIYALERISKESEEDYWPIMEILTAYVRRNSPNSVYIDNDSEVSLDIQAILNVIGRRKYYFNDKESRRLNLQKVCLHGASLGTAHLEGANLWKANLHEANLWKVNFKGTNLIEADLSEAYLKKAYLGKTYLKEANLWRANLEGANLQEAKDLTIDQLSKAKTLYKAQLDSELEDELRSKGFGHLLDDEPDE